MLAQLTDEIPSGEGWLYEPKWDGFRALVFRDGERLMLQSRELKPLERYFPELVEPLRAQLPERSVLDGEIVIVGERGLDFDALLLRIHPAKSRIARLAAETPASFVAWDLLALGDEDLRDVPLAERRARLESILADARPPLFVTPATRDRAVAADWFQRFEGAGFDGVVAKALDGKYLPGKRAMKKIKHQRTADCAVAGFRWHTRGQGTLVGSLLLGLYDDAGTLHHVGVTSAFTMERREALARELAPWRVAAERDHPWGHWREHMQAGQRQPGMTSRWNRGKDLGWEALRVSPDEGLVCEVAYDHLQGDRFRHATQFVRWRSDKAPRACRYDQLESTPPVELARIFGKSRH